MDMISLDQVRRALRQSEQATAALKEMAKKPRFFQRVKAVEALLQQGAMISQIQEQKAGRGGPDVSTPLHQAIDQKAWPMVTLLSRYLAGEQTESAQMISRRVLGYASLAGTDALGAVLAGGLGCKLECYAYNEPVKRDQREVVAHLLASGAPLGDESHQAFLVSEVQSTAMLQLLVDAGASLKGTVGDYNVLQRFVYLYGARPYAVEILQALEQAGAPADFEVGGEKASLLEWLVDKRSYAPENLLAALAPVEPWKRIAPCSIATAFAKEGVPIDFDAAGSDKWLARWVSTGDLGRITGEQFRSLVLAGLDINVRKKNGKLFIDEYLHQLALSEHLGEWEGGGNDEEAGHLIELWLDAGGVIEQLSEWANCFDDRTQRAAEDQGRAERGRAWLHEVALQSKVAPSPATPKVRM